MLKPNQKTENISCEIQKFLHGKYAVLYLEIALDLIKYDPVKTRKGIYHLKAHFSADLSSLLSKINTSTVVLQLYY